jgi:hypothetical protein
MTRPQVVMSGFAYSSKSLVTSCLFGREVSVATTAWSGELL